MRILAKDNDEVVALTLRHESNNSSRLSKDAKKKVSSMGTSPRHRAKMRQVNQEQGIIPEIPTKVVEVVQLDVVETYGPADAFNQDPKSARSNADGSMSKRIVAAQRTTLYKDQDWHHY